MRILWQWFVDGGYAVVLSCLCLALMVWQTAALYGYGGRIRRLEFQHKGLLDRLINTYTVVKEFAEDIDPANDGPQGNVDKTKLRKKK